MVMTRSRSNQALSEKADGASVKCDDFDEVAPPAWATFLVLAMVLASLSTAFYITPLAFVDGNKSKVGGYAGALSVVDDGGRLLYTLASIPFFLLMILGEFGITVVSKLQCKAGRYSLADTWSSLAAGITQQLFAALVRVPLKLTIVPYSLLHYSFSVPYGLNVSGVDWRAWVAGAVLVDGSYYWLHRWAHELRVLWAAHGVHHASDHYNLSTALRQSWLHVLVAWVFYLPLALVFPPALYFALDQLNLVYQFWIHTCVVRRLGPLEWLLMTPSHHRVHHDRRVHKNFGGVLIIWDRLFGTFIDEQEAVAGLQARRRPQPAPPPAPAAPEEEVCVFGRREPERSWAHAVLQTEELWRIRRAAAAASSLRGAWRAVWEGPGFHTSSAPRRLCAPASAAPAASSRRIRLPARLPPSATPYLLAQFGVATAVALAVLLSPKALYVVKLGAGVGVALPALYAQGLLLDGDGGEGGGWAGGCGVRWELRRTALLAALLLLLPLLLPLLPATSLPAAWAPTLLSSSFRQGAGALAGWHLLSFLWLRSLSRRPAPAPASGGDGGDASKRR